MEPLRPVRTREEDRRPHGGARRLAAALPSAVVPALPVDLPRSGWRLADVAPPVRTAPVLRDLVPRRAPDRAGGVARSDSRPPPTSVFGASARVGQCVPFVILLTLKIR